MTDETLRGSIVSIIDRLNRFYAELDGESPRPAAILAAARLEGELGDAIASKFAELASRAHDDIFKGYGPLSTFRARIDIAHALGFYGEQTRKTLQSARRVRNEFAHASEPIDFFHPEIAKRCRKFSPQKLSDPNDLRQRYILYLAEVGDSVAHVMAGLAIDSKIEPLP